ncbi:hypothetical protein CHARACLAT_018561 [Characodon lateralis]|uniref:Uncharacterized protein n=1 Tax=Characodon lateralis TaxID=208331 RepID=A0ABU7DIC1_9TELE|nr:hypothetical protein [Characodon lateralis]
MAAPSGLSDEAVNVIEVKIGRLGDVIDLCSKRESAAVDNNQTLDMRSMRGAQAAKHAREERVVSCSYSKRKSISAYFSHLKMFGGRKEMDILKKELEEELKLSTEDPRSHAWYHGPLTREVHIPHYICCIRIN